MFVGRLVPYKGADLLLEAAMPLLKSGRLTLDIVGDGPQMPHLRGMVQREGVQNAVTLAANRLALVSATIGTRHLYRPLYIR